MPQLAIPGLSSKPVGGPGVNGPDSGVNSASSGGTGKGCGSGTGDSKVGWLACWSRELAAAGVVAAAAWCAGCSASAWWLTPCMCCIHDAAAITPQLPTSLFRPVPAAGFQYRFGAAAL